MFGDFAQTDCSLYNTGYDHTTHTETLRRTVLHGVCWQGEQKVTLEDKGIKTARVVTVFIPLNIPGYLPPRAYEVDPAGHWTLRPGDLLVKGVAQDDGCGAAELHKRYDEVIRILGVEENSAGSPHMRHWEVTGV